jgi:hypothetical protein
MELDPFDLTVMGIRSVRLYRAVCEAEYQQWKRDGTFQLGPNSLEGKWFALVRSDAVEWGRRFTATSGIAHDRIVAVRMPEELYETFDHEPSNLDGIGPATYAPFDLLLGRLFDEVIE